MKSGVLKTTDRPLANPEVVLYEEFDDWVVLFHPLTGEAMGTNSVGAAIWKALNRRLTVEEIAAQIGDQFEDTSDAVLEDTIEFIEDLYRKMLVTLDTPADGK